MKLWDKGTTINSKIEAFTVGDDYLLDQNLIKYDILVNIAHAKMLKEIGILSCEELNNILTCLEEIKALHKNNQFKILQSQEDVHTAVEEFLIEKIGDVGKKIHTARSRNDQVLTDILLYSKEELENTIHLVSVLIKSLNKFAKNNKDIPMPGYTHMQKAMPYSVTAWTKSFVEMLEDDLAMLKFTNKSLNKCPLGSAAGFGVPMQIDKEMSAKELGFEKTFVYPLYTQNSKGKFEIKVLSAINQVMMTVNKITTDLMLFTTKEFEYFSLNDSFTTGSSIMPQKKNYDVLELVRAKTSSFFTFALEINSIYSNLMSGYNRDSQLFKKPLVEGFDTSKSIIEIMTLVFDNLAVNETKLKTAMSEELFATKEALKLVKQGVPFREAYGIVGNKYVIPKL